MGNPTQKGDPDTRATHTKSRIDDAARGCWGSSLTRQRLKKAAVVRRASL